MKRAAILWSVAAVVACAACGKGVGGGGSADAAAQTASAPAAAPTAAAAGGATAAATPSGTAGGAGAPADLAAPRTKDAPKADAEKVDAEKVVAEAAAALSGASGAPGPSAAAQPAAANPAARSDATQPSASTPAVPASAPAVAVPASAPAAAAAGAPADSPEAARRRAQIDWALQQDEIKNDRNGQWAVEAKASSTSNDAQGTAAFSANQATGAPNVEHYGNSGSAWTSKTADGGIEWLELRYAKAVHATAVRVRESYGSGAVIKVELFDEKGDPHIVWKGADPTKELNYLVAEFARTPYKTDRVRITLATNIVGGWNEIDAVQLVGSDQPPTATNR